MHIFDIAICFKTNFLVKSSEMEKITFETPYTVYHINTHSIDSPKSSPLGKKTSTEPEYT